jgi:regulation of enolase protein 1 (concanavalin A-like superfamily)
MDCLGRWLGEEHQWVTVQNRRLIGSQLRHCQFWIVTFYGYTLNSFSFSSETVNT